MDKNKSTNDIGIKRVEPRYVVMNEDIYDSLDVYERSVYEALRYESDYSKETSIVKRSIAFIVNKSKVSRRQVFRCLTSLETVHYLIQRLEAQVSGKQNNYNVSRTLNFFNPLPTSALDSPDTKSSASQALHDNFCTDNHVTSASQAPTSASQALLIINSFINRSTTSEFYSPAAVKSSTPNPLTPVELVRVYEEEFPDNPAPARNPATNGFTTSLLKAIKEFKKTWIADHGVELTEDGFRFYLMALKENARNFALKEYVHPRSGKKTKNGLATFLNVDNYLKFMNEEYS